jgi:hypothetical protein
MLQSSSRLSLLSEVRYSHLPPMPPAGQVIGLSRRTDDRDNIVARDYRNMVHPPEDTCGDTELLLGQTLGVGRLDVHSGQ